MTTDTAQPETAAENGDFDPVSAFDTFLADEGILPGEPAPRDERGRFAPKGAAEEPLDETEAEEGETPEFAEDEGEEQPEDEAADEAQPEASVPLPPSWSKEDEADWRALPASIQKTLSVREAQREHAVNSKFQEAANVRKAAEAQAQEAANNRDRYIRETEALAAALVGTPPPISMLHQNSPDYDPDTYHLMRAEYEQATQYAQTLKQQAAQAKADGLAQQQAAERAQFEAVESEWQPRLLATVPEFADPTKSEAIKNELRNYGYQMGIHPEALAEATSRDALLLWKAMQFDKQQAATQRVKAQAKPQSKPVSPALKPGVPVPQSAARRGQIDKARARLASTGRGEDAVALFEKLLG
jgi:hypothetical protein